MAAPYRKFVAVAVCLAGTAWVLPTHDDGVDAPQSATAVAPIFDVRVRRSTLVIAGHTASARHEQRLRQAAGSNFPDLERDFELRPLGVVPDWWSDATVDLVEALATMTSPTATLTEHQLRVRGLVPGTDDAQNALDAIRLPDELEVQEELLPGGPEVAADALCEREFEAFRAPPIRFEESGTALRASAYPAIDRIASLADACRSAFITITGHTDASGNPDWNKRLSRLRAEAVAAELAKRGIERARIVAVGAGSDVPIADNATRYGRSMNRRIEVAFASAD